MRDQFCHSDPERSEGEESRLIMGYETLYGACPERFFRSLLSLLQTCPEPGDSSASPQNDRRRRNDSNRKIQGEILQTFTRLDGFNLLKWE